MATISARVDDQLKLQAEQVADSIGISLSTAINIFLKRFSADHGFPFAVVAPHASNAPFNLAELDRSVKGAVADLYNRTGRSPVTYIDPETGMLTTKTIP